MNSKKDYAASPVLISNHDAYDDKDDGETTSINAIEDYGSD